MSLIFFLVVAVAASLTKDCDAVNCEKGLALTDPNDPTKDLSCSATTPCPNTYICTPIDKDKTIFVCCPSKTSVCTLGKVEGSTCGQAKASNRFYFDLTQKSCLPFTYNGCFGNDNNFATIADCENYCLKALCQQGIPAKVNNQIQICQVSATPSTCDSSYECSATTVFTAIPAVCCPKASVCNLGSKSGTFCPGTASNAIKGRWYFNAAQQACLLFNYMGCDGNENNFATIQECQQKCSVAMTRKLCPAGTSPAPSTVISNPCFGRNSNCSTGYSCQLSPDGSASYCCSEVKQVCPTGSVVEPSTLQNNPCITTGTTQCPNGFSCKQKDPTSKPFCCSDAKPTDVLCPTGSSPFLTVDKPTACVLALSTCPQGYNCQSTKTGSTDGFCCSISPDGFCETGSQPLLTLNKPTSCSLLATVDTCPAGSECQNEKTEDDNGFCCTTTPPQPPAGNDCGSLKPFLTNGQPTTCTGANGEKDQSKCIGSASPSICLKSASATTFFCCLLP